MRIKVSFYQELKAAHSAKLKQLGLDLKPGCALGYNPAFNKPVVVDRNACLIRARVDAYSYGQYNSTIVASTIGRYCSIGHYVEVGMATHNYKRPFTSSVLDPGNNFEFYTGKLDFQSKWLAERDNDVINKCTVGNDVWIGAHALITGAVTIGHGAVIGANAVVKKDVPPYAVVDHTGDIRRYRFSDEIISDLLELNWWDYDLPAMCKSGLKFSADNPQDFISFMRDQDLDKLPKIEDDWKVLILNDDDPDSFLLYPMTKDMDLSFRLVDIQN